MTTGSSVGCCRSRPFCGTGRADPTASRWRSPGFRPVFPWLQGLSFQTLSYSLFLSHRVGSSLSEQSILSGDRSEPQRVSHPALPGSHFFLRFHLFRFRERGREGEREGERGEGREKERERSISVRLPIACPQLRGLARNPGMCPDWESNQRPFGSQAGNQSTEPHQPGLDLIFKACLQQVC